MSKAQTLATTVSTGSVLADGTVAYSEVSGTPTLATVATSGAYADVTGTPTLATVATSGAYADVTGTPTLATVATSGSYTDLTDKPTISTTATNIAGGSAGTIPYQSAADTTAMLAVGTAGQLLQTNGAGAPTWVTPAPGAGTITAVASGSLANGTTVMLNSDGTVSAVSGTVGTEVTVSATTTAFSDGIESIEPDCCFDIANNKIVISYQHNNTGYGMAVVGTISGTSISFGTPVVFSSQTSTFVVCEYDPIKGKVLFVFKQTNSSLRAIVGTVSGTTISFGTSVILAGGNYNPLKLVYDPVNQTMLLVWLGDGEAGFVMSVLITDTTPSAPGGSFTFQTGQTRNADAAYISSQNQFLIGWSHGPSSDKGYCRTATVDSGGSFTFGTAVEFSPAQADVITTVYSPVADKTLVVWVNSVSQVTYARLATVSSSNVTFENTVTVPSVYGASVKGTYDTSSDRAVIILRDNNSSNTGKSYVFNLGGSTPSVGSAVTVFGTYPGQVNITYSTTDNKLVFVSQTGVSPSGTARTASIGISTNLTSGNFIGFSNNAYTNGQTATIQTVGSVDDAQSSLTTAQAYYVQLTGGVGLNPATPSVFAGTALSATKIIVKG